MADKNSSDVWDALHRAREKLSAQIGDRPEISLIDIGINPQSQEQSGGMVIRVHVRGQWTKEKVAIPEQMDGVRVVVVPGDYQLT